MLEARLVTILDRRGKVGQQRAEGGRDELRGDPAEDDRATEGDEDDLGVDGVRGAEPGHRAVVDQQRAHGADQQVDERAARHGRGAHPRCGPPRTARCTPATATLNAAEAGSSAAARVATESRSATDEEPDEADPEEAVTAQLARHRAEVVAPGGGAALERLGGGDAR